MALFSNYKIHSATYSNYVHALRINVIVYYVFLSFRWTLEKSGMTLTSNTCVSHPTCESLGLCMHEVMALSYVLIIIIIICNFTVHYYNSYVIQTDLVVYVDINTLINVLQKVTIVVCTGTGWNSLTVFIGLISSDFLYTDLMLLRFGS